MSIANAPVAKKIEKPKPQVAPLKVTFEPNLKIAIRAAAQKFKYSVKFDGEPLEADIVDTREEAEKSIIDALEGLGVTKDSMDRIAQVLALDSELKSVKGALPWLTHLAPPPRSAETKFFLTGAERGISPSVQVFRSGGNITGARCDLAIIDDAQQGKHTSDMRQLRGLRQGSMPKPHDDIVDCLGFAVKTFEKCLNTIGQGRVTNTIVALRMVRNSRAWALENWAAVGPS